MKTVGSLLVVMALVAGAVPLFTDCQSQGKSMTLASGMTIPMKCHWTAQAELALAASLLVVGGLMAFNRRREALRALSIVGAVMGVFIILLPTNLIGVCANPDMQCNMVMRPMLVFTGALTTAASLVALLITRREEQAALATEPERQRS